MFQAEICATPKPKKDRSSQQSTIALEENSGKKQVLRTALHGVNL